MAREDFSLPTNPYHYALHCLGGKWKMTILHEIYTHGSIHFNQTLKVIPLSEKVLSQQLKELIADGLVKRSVESETFPPSTIYELTPEARQLIPALDILVVHKTENYVKALGDIMEANGYYEGLERSPKR